MTDTSTLLKNKKIDQLLEQLSTALDPEEVSEAEMQLWTIWADSGRQPVNRMFDSATTALKDGEALTALTLMNGVVELAPQFAEGWNRRATVFILMQNYRAALKDLDKALMIEPRHFGAIWSKSLVHQAMGDTEEALAELERARSLNPHIDGMDERLDDLEGGLETEIVYMGGPAR